MEPNYEEQFTAFIDFLGFAEASVSTDDSARMKILSLLRALSALRGEFDLKTTVEGTSTQSQIKPAISTFSDHIVISFPLARIYSESNLNERVVAIMVMSQFNHLLTNIAAAALRIGFLIRGGATIGKLYHSGGVVFGEAMVEAFQIESRTSVYPRVVLSPTITRRPMWMETPMDIMRGDDGLYLVDYFKYLVIRSSMTGGDFGANVRAWFSEVVEIIARNLKDLESRGKLNELAKWAWFAHEFRRGLERSNPMLLQSLGVSLEEIPWGA